MSSGETYPPYIVYKNLKDFLGKRSLVLSLGYISHHRGSHESSSKDWLANKQFMDVIQRDGFIIVEAIDSKNKDRRYSAAVSPHCETIPTRTYVLIIDIAITDIKSGNIDSMIKKIPGITHANRDYNYDVSIITKDPLVIYTNRKMITFESLGSDTSGFISMRNLPYAICQIDPFSVKIVSPHRILSRSEEHEILQQLSIQKNKLPKMNRHDAIGAYIGVESGDVVEIQRFDESSGINIEYKTVL